MQSNGPEQVRLVAAVADARGKHRISAEFNRLQQDMRFLEEEIEQLEKMEKASTTCKELAGNVEIRPDPLLPETIGPAVPLWDRWFERPHESAGCKCWIL